MLYSKTRDAYRSMHDDAYQSHSLLVQSKGQHLDSDNDAVDESLSSRKPRHLRWLWATWLLVTVLLALNAALMVAYVRKKPSDKQCNDQLSLWSPLNDVVEYEEYDFQNDFDQASIYRGPPTPDLEEAWTDLWLYGSVRIPEEKLEHLNRTVDLGDGRTLQPVVDGKGGYQGLFEVFHQLHCLSMIRQYTWRDYYFRHPDKVQTPADVLDSDVGARMHVDHCLETLRKALMCHADTTPLMTMEDPAAPYGLREDFSAHHKCRKFDPLRRWTLENQLQDPRSKAGYFEKQSPAHHAR